MVELTDRKCQKDVVTELDDKATETPPHPVLETKKPGGVVGFSANCLPKELSPDDFTSESVHAGIETCRQAIAKFEYHMYGATFNVDKKRAIQKLFATADQILKEGIMIQCVEACLVALLLTDRLLPVVRFAISFESKCDDKTYRHLVLGLRYEGKFGSLGISRNCGLMTKAMTFSSLTELIDDFIKFYKNDGHIVTAVTFSKPIPHASPNTVVHWNYFSLQLQVGEPETRQLELERYTTRTLDAQIPFTSQFLRTKSLTQTHTKPTQNRGRKSSQSPVATRRGVSASRFRPGASPSPARRPLSLKTPTRTPGTKRTASPMKAAPPHKSDSEVQKPLFHEESDKSPVQEKPAKVPPSPSQKQPLDAASPTDEVTPTVAGTATDPTTKKERKKKKDEVDEVIPPPVLVPKDKTDSPPLMSPADPPPDNSPTATTQHPPEQMAAADTKLNTASDEVVSISIPIPPVPPIPPPAQVIEVTPAPTPLTEDTPQQPSTPSNQPTASIRVNDNDSDNKMTTSADDTERDEQPTVAAKVDKPTDSLPDEKEANKDIPPPPSPSPSPPSAKRSEVQTPKKQITKGPEAEVTPAQKVPTPQKETTPKTGLPAWNSCTRVSNANKRSGDEKVVPVRGSKEELTQSTPSKAKQSKHSKPRGRSTLMGPFATTRKVSPKPPVNKPIVDVSTPFAPDFDSETELKSPTSSQVVSFTSPKPESRNQQLIDQIISSPTTVNSHHQDPSIDCKPIESPARINLNTAVRKETNGQIDVPAIDPSLVESFKTAQRNGVVTEGVSRKTSLSPPQRSGGVESDTLVKSLPVPLPLPPPVRRQCDDDIPAIDPSLVASFKSAQTKSKPPPTKRDPVSVKTKPTAQQQQQQPPSYKQQLQSPLDGYAPLHLPPPTHTTYETGNNNLVGKPLPVPVSRKVTSKAVSEPKGSPSPGGVVKLLKQCAAEESIARKALEDLEDSGRQFKSSVMRAERESRLLLGNGGRNDVETAAAVLWKNVKTKREFKKEADYTRDQISSYLQSERAVYTNRIHRNDPLLEYLSTVETPLLTLEAALPNLTTPVADEAVVKCRSSWKCRKGGTVQKSTFWHQRSGRTAHSIGWYCTSLAKRWLRSPSAMVLEPTEGASHCEHEIVLSRPTRISSLAVISSAVAVQVSADCGNGYIIHRSSNICESCVDNGNYDEVQLSLLHIDLSNQPPLVRIKLLLLPHRKSSDAVFPLTYQSTHFFVDS